MGFGNEAEMAARVVKHLQEEGWDVYQEVEPRRWGSTADIVATLGPVVRIVECKLSMSMDLIGQAMEWAGYAHQICIAVPAPKRHRRDKRDTFVLKVLRDHGIGWLEVSERSWGHGVQERLRPGFRRRLVDNRVRDCLTEKHKTFAQAGTSNRRRWTPFQNTSDQVRRLVKQRPGISLKEIVDAVDHHYASDSGARASLSHWVQKGVIEGIEARREGKYLRFYPK